MTMKFVTKKIECNKSVYEPLPILTVNTGEGVTPKRDPCLATTRTLTDNPTSKGAFSLLVGGWVFGVDVGL